ncbi:DNA-binding transcriptional regulator, MarR family [Selenomonas sp. GACV-9]|uniref:MarR family winged helix-turn-helix transcriptional regulator n=1 Tax=Selenomonas sp. GACV-9 TaxID=3158782 RepID=UPI0008EF0CEB|nr:DNA-binding transcriptional regulator, MarR family [Selenomonas ruminantium]
MKKNEMDPLLLENQLCFPLYASARKIVAAYTPYLKPIGLTYAQYVTMMVLWEEEEITMHDLGQRLFLDSGTLTPLLKRLEKDGYLERQRRKEDERLVWIILTEKGKALRQQAESVPGAMACMVNREGQLFSPAEALKLKEQLYRIIEVLEK